METYRAGGTTKNSEENMFKWTGRWDGKSGWIGISYQKYDGTPSIADPAALKRSGFRLGFGLWFGLLSFERTHDN